MNLLDQNRWLFLLVPVVLSVAGCPGPEPETPDPTVSITGAISVDIGETLTLTAATANGDDSAYTWTSSNASLATVADGVVTGVAEGEVTITATGADTGAMATHGVVVLPATTVTPDPVVSVSVPTVIVELGMTVTATASTANGTDASYTWASSDDAVATVDTAGVVTGVAIGEVIITATGDDTAKSASVGLVVSYAGGGVDPEATPPQYAAWLSGAHANTTAEAFNHWNGDTPAEVPTACARCHSTSGFRDLIGDDGTAAGTVENAVPVGEVITCNACHNATAQELDSVTFPSGVTLTGLGPQARCQTCHQGRESTVSVDDAIGTIGDDTVDAGLGFLNVHYFAAGATRNGGWVMGGYQYAGSSYDGQFQHALVVNTCNGCHDPHSLEIKTDVCANCHSGVTQVSDLYDIRMFSSVPNDYDGDGNKTEGIYYELEGLRDALYAGLQAYATATAGVSDICYSGTSYPYFFIDTDNSGGACDASEANYGNRYDTWTPRLLRASYNFQYSQKDPGAFAHNAKYVIQLLFDSLSDLTAAPAASVRNDQGHFAGSEEPFRHWDGDGEVAGPCSKCHGGTEGFDFYLEYGTYRTVDAKELNGLHCETCHSDLATGALKQVTEVTFPGGTVINDYDTGGIGSACATCHSGRNSKLTIDEAIANNKLAFQNVHYLSAAGTLMGSDAGVGYEYDTKTYAGRRSHTPGISCNFCHNAKNTEHTFQPNDNLALCSGCHGTLADVTEIRNIHNQDYDGDTDSTEPLADELSDLGAAVLAQLEVAANANGADICYSGTAYPYFFKDLDASGTVCDATEASFGNRYTAWTPAMMKAAHNYQISRKEPGAWAHNFDYAAQLLIDSVEDLGGDISGYIRP